MGVSDRYYFDWLRGALERFEAGSGQLAALRRGGSSLDLWVLAGARPSPPVEFLLEAMGRDRTTVHFLDKFAPDPGVVRLDFNALAGVPDNACDVLLMSRASYMIETPRAFLSHVGRLVRPGGVAIVDWVHGSADAPALDLPGFHEYDGQRCGFFTTYVDPAFPAEWRAEFEAFLRHVNRPPWTAGVTPPRGRRALGALIRRLVGRGPRRSVTLATYIDVLRDDLGRAGRHLIEPGVMEEFFKVAFREARYFYPLSRKFHLYLLTVLRPVGK